MAKKDVTKVSISRDGIVKFWSVYDQTWTRRHIASMTAQDTASMTAPNQARIIAAQKAERNS